jgi:hypothetical protein
MNMENNYFTKDLQKTINEMTDSEMNAALLELEGTNYWVAILRYFQQRMIMAQNALITIDPIKEATKMCRNQGTMMGLSDLQSTVITLKEESDRKKPKTEK